MKYRLATALALIAVLLQTAQPLFAALTPMMSMANQHSIGADAVAMTEQAAATPGATRTAPMPMHAGGNHSLGCCCQGPWSCGGPCGILPLGARPATLTLAAPAHIWAILAGPRLTAAHPLELLRPPTDS